MGQNALSKIIWIHCNSKFDVPPVTWPEIKDFDFHLKIWENVLYIHCAVFFIWRSPISFLILRPTSFSISRWCIWCICSLAQVARAKNKTRLKWLLVSIKVQAFLEAHIIWKKSALWFWRLLVNVKTIRLIFSNYVCFSKSLDFTTHTYDFCIPLDFLGIKDLKKIK